MPVDYQLNKIYKLYNPNIADSLVYYGSTSQKYLSSRLASHRSEHKQFNDKKIIHTCSSYKLFDAYGLNVIIELVEKYPCTSADDARIREGIYQTNNECVNKYTAGRSSKVWRAEHPELIKAAAAESRARRKEKINEKFICDCGGRYTCGNKSTHMKSVRHSKYIEDTNNKKTDHAVLVPAIEQTPV